MTRPRCCAALPTGGWCWHFVRAGQSYCAACLARWIERERAHFESFEALKRRRGGG